MDEVQTINNQETTNKQQTAAPLGQVKRIVSWVKQNVIPYLFMLVVFVIFWTICGKLSEKFIFSRAYIMAYGFWVGVFGIWWTDKLMRLLFKLHHPKM